LASACSKARDNETPQRFLAPQKRLDPDLNICSNPPMPTTPASDPEERRHQEIIKALYKIVEVIHSLKGEIGLLKETVKTFKPLQ
jgi:hypothetical protein